MVCKEASVYKEIPSLQRYTHVYARHASLLAWIPSTLKAIWHQAIHTHTHEDNGSTKYSWLLEGYASSKRHCSSRLLKHFLCVGPHQMPRLHHQHTADSDRRPALFQLGRDWAHGMYHRRHQAPTITKFCWTGMLSHVRFKLKTGSGNPH